MTTEKHNADGCLMCAVRALTEGEPNAWVPGETGSGVTGVVLAMGETDSPSIYDLTGQNIPYVDLWLGGRERVRIMAFGATLRRAVEKADPKIGDTLTVTFDGYGEINTGKHRGLKFRQHTVNVVRGHH
jgi:hypothetical protein